MDIASCQCANDHQFNSRIVEDSADINCLKVEHKKCPECGAEFIVVETYTDKQQAENACVFPEGINHEKQN